MSHIFKQRPDAKHYNIWSDGEYADIFLTSKIQVGYCQGNIVISSSYGTWSYFFSYIKDPIERFLSGATFEYLGSKLLGSDFYVIDWHETKTKIYDSLYATEIVGNSDKQSILNTDSSYEDLIDWLENHGVNHAEDLIQSEISFKPDVHFKHFWDELWVPFIKELGEIHA